LSSQHIDAQKLRIIDTKFYCNGHYGTFSEIYDVIQTSDKGFAFTGATADTGGGILPICHNPGTHPLFGKLDSVGNVQWIRICDSTNYAFSLCQTPDGGYASSGGIHNYSSMNIIRYDKQGNLLWYKEYGKNASCGTNQIINTPDHGFLLLGFAQGQDVDIPYNYTWPPISFQPSDWVVMKLDSLGNKQWVRVLGTSGDEGSASILSVGTHYYLIGRTVSKDHDCADTANHPGPGGSTYTIKLDALGNTVWSKAQYGAILNGAMYDDRDNSILITGRGSGNRQGVTGYIGMDDMLLMKLDTGGNFKWGKLYGTTSDEKAYGICKGANNNFLLVGMSYDNTNFIDRGILVNIDSAGGVLDQKIITGDGGVTFLRAYPFTGSFAVFGISYSKNLSEGTGQNCVYGSHGSGALTLSKIDLWKTGVAKPSTWTDQFTLLPNPAQNEFEIRFSELNSAGRLSCFNAAGQSIFSQKISARTAKITVATDNWASGNYFICLQPEGGLQTCRSLIIH
jgi:hypothetical protein